VPAGGDGDAQARADLGPLPGGHHGLSREEVTESQRERLLAAIAEVIAESGYQAATITEIVKRASVANRVFYENFEDKETAFLAVFDVVYNHLGRLIAEAVAEQKTWAEQVVAALRAGLSFFAAEPDLARLSLVAPFTATPAIVARFRDVISEAGPYLARGREQRPEAEQLPPSTEDGVLGGMVSIAARSVFTDERPLLELLPDLIEFMLGPYLGPSAARRLARKAA
jgi:AcrR family transcriptional regulator